jgi:competence protein ComGG
MGRQDGVIFPLVAVVALLLAFFMTNAALLYEAEQQAAHAARQAAEADELVQMAVFDVKEQIAATAAAATEQEGGWTYPRGEAVYRWQKETEASVRVFLTVRSAAGLQRTVAFTVALPSLDITEWTEQNG